MKKETYKILKEQVRDHEGYVEGVYQDSLGYYTAGVGHLLRDDDPPKDDPCWNDPDFLDELYEKDLSSHLEEAKDFVGRDVWDDLPEKAQLVVADMAFNLGGTKLAKWKNFRKSLREHNWEMSIYSMVNSLWYKQVGRRSKYLVTLMEKLVSTEEITQ